MREKTEGMKRGKEEELKFNFQLCNNLVACNIYNMLKAVCVPCYVQRRGKGRKKRHGQALHCNISAVFCSEGEVSVTMVWQCAMRRLYVSMSL